MFFRGQKFLSKFQSPADILKSFPKIAQVRVLHCKGSHNRDNFRLANGRQGLTRNSLKSFKVHELLEFLHFVDQDLDSLFVMLVLGYEDFLIKLFCLKQLLVSKLGLNA